MISSLMNGAVHIFSLFVFLFLFGSFLKKKREADLLRDFFRESVSPRVYVNWPLKFISHFCAALDIPFSGCGRLHTGRPQSLNKQLLFETVRLYGVNSIEYKVSSDSAIQLFLFLKKDALHSEVLQRDLSEALKMDVMILTSKESL